ncbi:AAA family ATPase [Haloplanus ruber]|uniref:Replication factor C small subunit n=1 Tax=Haloplanus ruber TaxID=869892 RepID=A0ABD6CWK6_9EURY|nr:AAA family ATPase [Haloplanus ruber]
MDAPLWTDTHAPSLDDLPQSSVRDRLRRAVDEPMNLVVQGPPGAGKTAAVRALAEAAHADPANDLVEINVADFFGRTKKELREDPRFEQFLAGRSRMAKRDMINRVLKESASYAPMSGDYKTIVLDNAEAIREDFQQALRRVMEQYHRTTQFVIVTRQPSTLIAPIRSRCFPVPVRAPTSDEIEAVVEGILTAEDVPYDEDGLEFVSGYAEGDLRRAILGAQTTAEQADEVTMSTVHETLQDVGHDDDLESVLAAAEAGNLTDARKTVGTLLDDEGYDGQSLLVDLLSAARRRYDGEELAHLHRLAGDIDHDLVTGTDDRLHLAHLLSTWGARAEGQS